MKTRLLKFLFTTQLFILAVSTFSVNTFADNTFPETIELENQEKFLTLACSDWKPYCYKENSKIKGAMINVSELLMEDAGFEYTLDVLPWKRVYRQGLRIPNFLILGLGRTEKRETLFKWIAPLKKPSDIMAYQKADSDIALASRDDLSKYTIAVERGSYTHEFLVINGHDEEKMILVSRYVQLYNLVESNRAQLFLMDSKVFRPEAIRNNINPAAFKSAILAFVVTEYLATGLNTSDSVVNRLKESYHQLVLDGQLVLPD